MRFIARSSPPTRPRLLACDVDGTLVDATGFLDPAVRDAIRLISDSGVEVVLATGRSPWNGIELLARTLGLAGPQITMQGALLMTPNTGLLGRARSIPPEAYLDALAVADELGLDPIVAFPDGTRGERLNERVEASRFARNEATTFTYVDDLAAQAGSRPLRIFVAVEPTRHAAVVDAFTCRLADRAAITWTGQQGIEVLSPGTDKGEALAWLAGVRGIERPAVAAIGDAMNDLGMLRWAGRSAAMPGAPAVVRASADVVVTRTGARAILGAFAWFFPDISDAFESLGCWGLAEPVA